jgi:hypothetical protein
VRHWLIVFFVLVAVSTAPARDYNSPLVDGHVTVDASDWCIEEWAVDDSPYDCRWGCTDPDLDDLYVTWDSCAVYVGITTQNLPSMYGNWYLLYMDTDAQNGITGATDFTGADFCPRSITFSTMGVEALLAVENLDVGSISVRHCSDPMNTTAISEAFVATSAWWLHIEATIPWNGLYGLGDGVVPPGSTLRFIAVVAGGEPSGAYDAMPTSSTCCETDPELPWYEYTDLDVYYEAIVDADGDGVPDSGSTTTDAWSWGKVKNLFR